MAKYGRRVFDGDAIKRLRAIFAKVCADFEAQLIEMDSEDDHVHLLVEYPPKVAVSNLVNSLKGVSSRLLRKDRPDVKKAVVVHQFSSCASSSSSSRHHTEPQDG